MSQILLFNRWSMDAISVKDPGLRMYMNVTPLIVPRSGGRYGHVQIQKSKMPLVERFATKLMVPGHRGKKHKYTSRNCTASANAIMLAVMKACELIEQRTKKNPVQILVDAVENASLYEEIASYRLGGIIARQGVTISPHRRLDLALRTLAQGIYHTGFGKKGSLPERIAKELIAAANNDPTSFAIQERNRIDKEAEGAK